MSQNPIDIYKQYDPEIIECYKNLQNVTYGEGALKPKFKLLIALAIDIEHGAMQGAIALGRQAITVGASKEEIVEAMRVAYQIGGNRALFTSAQVLQTLFKQEKTSP